MECSTLHGSFPWLELCPGWNFAVHGTLPRMELCLGWNFAVHGTLTRLELYLGWNSALPGTLPRLELCPTWIFSLAGTLPRLELCVGWNSASAGTMPWMELYPSWNSAPAGLICLAEPIYQVLYVGILGSCRLLIIWMKSLTSTSMIRSFYFVNFFLVSGRSIWFIDLYLVSLIWFVDLYRVSLIWYPGIIFDVHGKLNIYIVLFICDFKNGWSCITFVTKII